MRAVLQNKYFMMIIMLSQLFILFLPVSDFGLMLFSAFIIGAIILTKGINLIKLAFN